MELIDKIKKTGASVDKISKDTGIPTARIYKWFSGKALPKYADAALLEEFLNMSTQKEINFKADDYIKNDKNELSLHLLIKSNSILSDANKALAEANNELTIMLKNSVNSNGQNSQQNLAEKVLHRIAEKGVPELWASKEEGMKKLNNFLIGAPQDIIESYKQHKEGK